VDESQPLSAGEEVLLMLAVGVPAGRYRRTAVCSRGALTHEREHGGSLTTR